MLFYTSVTLLKGFFKMKFVSSNNGYSTMNPLYRRLFRKSWLEIQGGSMPAGSKIDFEFQRTTAIIPATLLSSTFHKRFYANTSRNWEFNRVQYTKYRISKPWTVDTQFEDLILSEPSKDDFAKFTKEMPIFLRFLKLVTEVEKRPQSFIDFARRCESGLSVEKDVFISKKELIESLWTNGYSEKEISAFELAFPPDYRFHYPELAVLFDLDEESCYQYCLRQRTASPEKLVEIKYKKPTNLLSSYGLSFLGVWFGLSNTVLSNMWFYAKTFPFGAVFYMLSSNFYREIREYFWKEERAMIQTAKNKKDEGEKMILSQIKKYANDAKCFDYLSHFKSEVQMDLCKYRQAFVSKIRHRLTGNLLQKLVAIQQAEKSIESSLQEVVVLEIVSAYKQNFSKQPLMQEDAFRSALVAISGHETQMDPVGSHFKRSLQELQKVNLAKIPPKSTGSVIERISAAFREREDDFLNSFTIRFEDAKEAVQIAEKCKAKAGFDFGQLNQEEIQRLEELYRMITSKMGFDPLHENELQSVDDAETVKSFTSSINNEIETTKVKIRNARLQNFIEALE